METASYIKTTVQGVVRTKHDKYLVLNPIWYQLHVLGIRDSRFCRKFLIDEKMSVRQIADRPVIQVSTDRVGILNIPESEILEQYPFYGIVTLVIIPRRSFILRKLFGNYKIKLVSIMNV